MSADLRGIVVLCCDQLRADHLGFGGNPDVRTPHLDALAARSVVYDEAYVANPTCMPNRATIMTGRWPSVHGSRTNGLPLDWRADTFARVLRRAGWSTAAAGKLHLQNMGWPWEDYEVDDIRATNPLTFDERTGDAVRTGLPDGWDTYEDFDRHLGGYVTVPPDYYGFDRVDLVVGHADAPSGHYRHWVRERGLDIDAVAGYENARRRYAGWDEVWQSEVPAELHPTTFVAEHLVARLHEMAAGDAPFLLFGSFADPHHPFSPPAPYFGMYDPAAVHLPATFEHDHALSPPHIRMMLAERGRPRVRTACWAPDEHQLRAALAAEYGLITFIDDAVGRVLETIDTLGLTDRVAVVFTSDHGDMLGDHGLMLKHAVHYRALTRVPLTLHVPGGPTGRTSALTSSADLAPTLIELAGLVPFRGIQGRSLVGDGGAGRTALVVEEEHLFGIRGLPAPIALRTLVTPEARLTIYERQPFGELYDRTVDPDERVNRWDDPAAAGLRAAMTERLVREMLGLADRGIAPRASA